MGKYTILVAHPDDELLWMWPALKDAKRIVCASSDLHNPERKRYQKRRYCLEKIGKMLDIEVVCFDNNSGFYRLPTRNGELKKVAEEIMGKLESPVFTHNPWGEYGHLDHILCHQIARASGLETYCTDTVIEANWLPVKNWLPNVCSWKWELDLHWFANLKQIYLDSRCWTWTLQIPIFTNVIYTC